VEGGLQPDQPTAATRKLNGVMQVSTPLIEQLHEIDQCLHAHPANLEYVRCVGLSRTLDVFKLNWTELMTLLDRAATDASVAMELVQNVHRPDVRRAFNTVTVQRLHNYVASAMMLVDHSRHVMRGRVGPLQEGFAARKSALLANPEVPFIQGLRNYTLHRSLPLLRHQFGAQQFTTPDVQYGCEVHLSVAQLLEWNGWSAVARRFLEGQNHGIPLRPTIARHAEAVIDVTTWLLTALTHANARGVAEVNALIIEYNALLENTSMEEAKKAAADRMKPRDTRR
jgi:hypothetical protein